jgi:hypothetical protein
MAYEHGPFLTENDTTTTITPSAATGTITLTASAATFEAGHVGSLWQIGYAKATTPVTGALASATTSSVVAVALGQTLDYSTHGSWTGTISLQVSRDGGTNWESVYTFSSVADTNREDSVEEEAGAAQYRWNMIAFTSGSATVNLSPRAQRVNGTVRITTVSSSTAAVGTVIETLGNAAVATTLWAEGSWSDKRGWPRTGTFFQQRLFLAGTTHQPTTIWGSVSLPGGDFDNFLAGTDDDSAVTYTIAESQDPIKWIAGERSLIAGTAGGPYAITGNQNGPLTATNPPSIVMQDVSGSADMAALRTSLGLLFIERGAKRVHELVYSWEADKFVAANMTRLAEHITGSGIKEIALQRRPERTVWCVTNDGELAALTYLRSEDIAGWHRHITDGIVESVAVKPGSTTTGNDDEDEVWCLVRRTINGAAVRYIERIMPWSVFEGDQEDAFYVDCGITYDSTSTTTITGLSHLEGETVKILADGGAQPDKVVASGSITLDNAASVVHVGLPYTHKLTPTRPILGPMLSGSIQRIVKAAMMFYKSNAAKYGEGTSDARPLDFQKADGIANAPIPLFTGTRDFTFPGGWQRETDLTISGDDPLPCNVLSMVMLVESN